MCSVSQGLSYHVWKTDAAHGEPKASQSKFPARHNWLAGWLRLGSECEHGEQNFFLVQISGGKTQEELKASVKELEAHVKRN